MLPSSYYPPKTLSNTINSVVDAFPDLRDFSMVQGPRVRDVILGNKDSSPKEVGVVEDRKNVPSIDNILDYANVPDPQPTRIFRGSNMIPTEESDLSM